MQTHCFNLMGVIFVGVVWAGLAMIWVWLVGVGSVLELVFKKLEPMNYNEGKRFLAKEGNERMDNEIMYKS